MNYKEFKDLCDSKIKTILSTPEIERRYRKEIRIAERFYINGIDLHESFRKAKSIDTRYVIPYLLGFTNTVDLEKPIEYIQIKEGDSGGK